MTRKEALTVFFEHVKKAYIEDQQAKNIRASGRSAASLRDEITDAVSVMYGSEYIYFQKFGRKPGGFPPLEAIMDWLRVKTTIRIDDERGPGLRGLAFAIAKKIAQKGTDVYQGKRPGLSVDDKIAEARKDLVKSFTEIFKQEYLDKLKSLKK